MSVDAFHPLEVKIHEYHHYFKTNVKKAYRAAERSLGAAQPAPHVLQQLVRIPAGHESAHELCTKPR